MKPDVEQPSFKQLLLAVGNLGDDGLAQAQSFVQKMLDSLLPEQLSIGRNIELIDMNYFEVLKANSAASQKPDLDTVLKHISRLDPEKLVLLDVMIIFLHHNLDFKAALPEISKKVRYEVKSPSGIRAIIGPDFILPDKTRPVE